MKKRIKSILRILTVFVLVLLLQMNKSVLAAPTQDQLTTDQQNIENSQATGEQKSVCVVKFLNEDEIVKELSLDMGVGLTAEQLPSVPEREGYTGAWYIGENEIKNGIENITENLNITVRWQPKSYQITFDSNGGNQLSLEDTSLFVTYDSTFGKLPTVTRRGYVFTGWFNTKYEGKKFTKNSRVDVKKDTVLYAGWETFVPKTLQQMKNTNYYADSITGLTDRALSKSNIIALLKSYGTYTGKGMPTKLYKEAMQKEWIDCTDYKNEPKMYTIDVSKTMNYDSYEKYLLNLSRYDGVYLYEIGRSTEGKKIYAIEVDFDSKEDKKVFCLTGQTHSREFAGGVYIVKQLYELVQKAQTDDKTRELLKHYKYVAVPIISLDVREGLIKNPSKWIEDGQLWKAYANGTDGNRNYPGLQWGQIYKNYTLKSSIARSPGYANYPGSYAGSCSETQAMMKWFYHYVVVEQAVFHIDYHQQGSIIYSGKPWQSQQQLKRCRTLTNGLLQILNSGNSRRYIHIAEDARYGLQGEGSTATDFSVSLAVGAKYSPAYGFYVFPIHKQEVSLLKIRNLSMTKLEVNETNSEFATATFEIGCGTQYLGNSANTRKLLAQEYKNYHYSQVLEKLPLIYKSMK